MVVVVMVAGEWGAGGEMREVAVRRGNENKTS